MSEDDELYGEEGEFEGDEHLLETINNLDPETKKKFEAGELSMDDLRGLGILGEGDQFGEEDYGSEEEGELEQNGDENEESAHKKQKTEEE